MASNQPPNSIKSSSSVYESAGGFRNFVHSYGGRMWNDEDVQEAKAIGAAMREYDAQQAKDDAQQATTSSGTDSSIKSGSSAASNHK